MQQTLDSSMFSQIVPSNLFTGNLLQLKLFSGFAGLGIFFAGGCLATVAIGGGGMPIPMGGGGGGMPPAKTGGGGGIPAERGGGGGMLREGGAGMLLGATVEGDGGMVDACDVTEECGELMMDCSFSLAICSSFNC